MDLRHLECFLAVEQYRHFRRAAEALYLAQPTISESIRRLEQELGGPLFERTTRRVELTALGERFRDDAQAAYDAVLLAYSRARAFAQSGETQIVVGYTGDLCPELMAAAAEIQRRQPDISVTLRSLPTARQMSNLRQGKLQLALAWAPGIDEGLEAVELGRSSLVVVMPSNHPLAQRESVALVEVAHEPLVAWTRTLSPGLYDRFAAVMDATGAPWSLVGVANGFGNVVPRVLAGIGLGVMLESFAPTHPIDGIAIVRVRDADAQLPRMLVWRSDERHPLVVELRKLIIRRSSTSASARCALSPHERAVALAR